MNFLCVAAFLLLALNGGWCTDDDAIRTTYDGEGVLWTEYHDDATGRSYFHETATGRTQWKISLPASSGDTVTSSDEVDEGGHPKLETAAKKLQQDVGKTAGGDEDSMEAVPEAPTRPKKTLKKTKRRNRKDGRRGQREGGGNSRKDNSLGRDQMDRQPLLPPRSSRTRSRWTQEPSSPDWSAGFEPLVTSDHYGEYTSEYGSQAAGGYGGYSSHVVEGGQVGQRWPLMAHNEGEEWDVQEYYGGYGDGDQLAYLMDVAVLEELAVAMQSESGEGYLEAQEPVDAETLHLLEDPAGMLQLENVVTAFDHLGGISSRGEFENYQIKSPLLFHEMQVLRAPFVSGEDVVGVEKVREFMEERVVDDDLDLQAWEQLGHVWRHYGNVPRTIDCYRKALLLCATAASPRHPSKHAAPKANRKAAHQSSSLEAAVGADQSHQPESQDLVHVRAIASSLHINLAGLLDQMDFVDDALVVLHALLDGGEVDSMEVENNFAVAYMMVSQLELRAKRLDRAESALSAALQLRPRLGSAVAGVQRELRHWKKTGVKRPSSPPPPPWPRQQGGHRASAQRHEPRQVLDRVLAVLVSWFSDDGGLRGSLSSGDPWLLFRGAGLCLAAVDQVEALLNSLLDSAFVGMVAAKKQQGGGESGPSSMLPQLRVGHSLRAAAESLGKSFGGRPALWLRKAVNAVPCVCSGFASRAITELGWLACIQIDFVFAGAEYLLLGRKQGAIVLRDRKHHPPPQQRATSVAAWFASILPVSPTVVSTVVSTVAMGAADKHSITPAASGGGSSPVKTVLVQVYLAVPLFAGHSFALFSSDFSVVDTLVLLFVGALLFHPLLRTATSNSPCPSSSTSGREAGVIGPFAFTFVT